MCAKHFETRLLFDDEEAWKLLISLHDALSGFPNLIVFHGEGRTVHSMAPADKLPPDGVHLEKIHISRVVSEAEKANSLSVTEYLYVFGHVRTRGR